MASNYAQFKNDPPTGTIMAWSTATAPAGFLLCNGDPVSRSTYAALFAVISTTYGTGDGATTFNLPDLQGKQLIFDDISGNTYTLAGNTGAASATINTNITNNLGASSSISGDIADTTLDVNQIPNHRHKMFAGNTSRPGTGSVISTPNQNVVFEGSGGNAGYIMRSDPSNLTPTGGNTGTTVSIGNNNNGGGSGHTHGRGNLAVSTNITGNVAASTNNVSSLLFTSIVLNAIIKI